MARFFDSSPAATSSTATADYTQGMTRSVFNDPRFIKDLRDTYSSKGLPVSAMTDGELINRMMSDGTWREMGNSLSVVKGLAEANNATTDERERMRRLQAVYDIAPGVFEEGGRGAAGFFDNVAAAVLDPVNLIGGVAAKGASQAATRLALAGGATARQAGRAGLKSGIGKAAVSEAAINAGAEGIANVGTQMRDVELGIQDKVNLGEAAGSAAIAAGLGGVLGGVISAPAAVAGVRSGREQFDALGRVLGGAEDPSRAIAGMSNQQASDILSDPDARAQAINKFAPVGPNLPAGGIPPKAPEIDPKLALDASRLEARITGLRAEYDNLTADGLFEDAGAAKYMLDKVANLRGMQARLAEEANTIDKLTKSEVATDLAEAARRRSQFEADFSLYRAVIADPENPAYDEAVKKAVGTPPTPKPGKSAPETGGAPPATGSDAPAATPDAAAAAPAAAPKGRKGKAPAAAPVADAPVVDPVAAAPVAPIITPAPSGPVGAAPTNNPPAPAAAPTATVINMSGRKLTAQFLELTQPLLSSGMTRTDMGRALGMIVRGLNMNPKEATRAVASFEAKIANMRERGTLRAGDDMDLSQGGIFDRSLDGLKLGDEETSAALMSLRSKLAATVKDVRAADSADRAVEASVAGATPVAAKPDAKPLVEEMGAKEREVLNILVASEQRENPDFTPAQARMSAISRIINSKDAPTKSATPSNAARLESMAPADPKGRGTRSVAIKKGSDYAVDRSDFVSKLDLNLAAAKIQAEGPRGEGRGLVAFVSTGQERVVGVPGGKADKGATLYYDAVTKRAYPSEPMARKARGEAPSGTGDQTPAALRVSASAAPVAEAGPTSASVEMSLTSLLSKFDPKGDGTGDGAGLWQALQDLAGGKAPDMTPAKPKPAPQTSAGGMLIIQRKSDGATRMMSPAQAKRGGSIDDLLGTSKAEDWEVRYAPADAVHTRDPGKLSDIFDRSAPEEVKPKTAETKPLSFAEASNVSIDLSPEDMEVIAQLGGDKSATSIQVLELADLLHKFEGGSWKAVAEKGGVAAYANILERAYAIQARINPLGVVMPQQTRAEAIEALENIFGARNPAEVEASVRLLNKLAGDKAPNIMSRKEAGGSVFTHYGLGEQRIELSQTGVYKPRSMIFYHEMAHWSYWNILTPEDRLTFWRDTASKYAAENGVDEAVLARGIGPQAGMSVATKGGKLTLKTNAYTSPQEFFANQFEVWAARKLSGEGMDEGVLNSSIWTKLIGYVEELYNRYVRGVEIDPNLEQLFSKILPEDQRLLRESGIKRSPDTPTGKAINQRLEQTRYFIKSIDESIAGGGTETLIETFNDAITKLLLSLTQNSEFNTGIFIGGRTKPIKRLQMLIRQRVADFNQITTGVRPGTDSGEGMAEASLRADGLTIVGDRGDIADQLVRFYQRGYQEGGIVPEDAVVQAMIAAGKIKNMEQTSFRSLLVTLEAELVKAYHTTEGGLPTGTKVKTRPEVTVTPEVNAKVEKTLKKAVTKEKRLDAAADAMAKSTLSGKGKPAKPKSATIGAAKASKGEAPFADSLRSKSEKDLRALYVATRKDGDQVKLEAVAATLISKQQAKALPAEKVKLPAAYRQMGGKQLESALLDALYEGNAEEISRAAYETSRRAHNKRAGADGQPIISAIYDKSVEAIEREIEDNVGVPTSVGIPPNARAWVREMLSYMTHREPMVQYTLRTMAYRMVNLMGKTTKNALDEAGLISTDELARLANVDPSRVARAAFVDFRAEEFKGLRTDLRRTAIALNKGTADPIDLMHEVGHMVMRGGLLSREESDGVLTMFTASDDAVKDRIIKLYAGKYAGRIDRDQLLAEEWFSEQLALYMAERVTRGDIFDAAARGDASGLILRGVVDRAIDRTVEFVAYVLNGLIGNKSLKQTFRRLSFYGDMFAAKAAPPLSKEVRVSVHKSYAAAHAADRFMSSPRGRADQIRSFIGQGVGFDSDLGEPLVFFHGTPRGDVLGRAKNPDAIMLPSRNGQYGPGIYVTENASVADTIYSRRPTQESLERQYELTSTDQSKDGIFEGEMRALSNVRRNLTISRQEYTNKLFDYDKADEITQEILLDELDETRREIDLLVRSEIAMMDGIASDYKLAHDPLVLPLYVRMLKPADFQSTTDYAAADPFIRTLTDHLASQGLITRRAADGLIDDVADTETIRGNSLYNMLVSMIEKKSGGAGAAKVRLSAELERLGYDGLVTTHVNMGSFADSLAADGIAYAGAPIQHRTLVSFSSKNVKHIEAAEFDPASAQVYYRQTLPIGTAGSLISEIVDNSLDGLLAANPARVGETAEAAGAPRGLSGALMSMMRRRPLSGAEQQSLMDTSPIGWLRSQSSQMEKMGMNWMAQDYKDYFPKVYERFAARTMPTVRKINALPDAKNGISGWFYKASGGIGQDVPESLGKIGRAIRAGVDSRHWRGLSGQQAEIAKDVMSVFRSVYRDLRKAGVMVGDAGENYLPQVWKKDHIVKNRDEFLSGMVRYYQMESTSLGRMAEPKDANDFAERMYLTLAGEDADGVFIPGGPSNSGSRNTTADSVDFNRMIRLNEYPAAMQALEKFLEDDVMSLTTKYVEAAERRLLFVNKWGVNGHAFHDYMKVAQEGAAGIAELLSKNKEFRKNFQYLNERGAPEEGTLVREVGMPFAGREAEAREFANSLVEAYASGGGGPTVRKMLMEIAPAMATGDIPHAFERRVDAIVGAMDDFKNRPALTGEREEMFITNAMQVLMQKRQIGTLEAGYRFSNTVRNFNNISLLGFTTLSSLGDLALPLIRSGSMKDYLTAMKGFATDPDYREMIYNTGVAIESLVHERMLNMYGGTSDKFNQAFFNATLLTPWTDMSRQLAGAVGYESLRTMQKRALAHFKPGVDIPKQSAAYKTADRYLTRYGLADFLPGGPRAGEMINPDMARSDGAVRLAIIKFADDSVFVPNPNDVPLWAQTPVGKIIWQLKSFPMMMSRMAGDLLDEARQGNIAPLMYLLSAGPAFGMTALAVKDVVQMRGGEDDREAALRDRSLDGVAQKLGFDAALHGDVDTFMGWYVEGLLLAGGVGLIGDILYGVADNAENGAYGQVRMASLLGGPTVGLGFSAYNAYAGAQDAVLGSTPDSNAKERSGVRDVVGRVPILGGVRSIREGVTDALAGEAPAKGNGWSQEWAQKDWAQKQ